MTNTTVWVAVMTDSGYLETVIGVYPTKEAAHHDLTTNQATELVSEKSFDEADDYIVDGDTRMIVHLFEQNIITEE